MSQVSSGSDIDSSGSSSSSSDSEYSSASGGSGRALRFSQRAFSPDFSSDHEHSSDSSGNPLQLSHIPNFRSDSESDSDHSRLNFEVMVRTRRSALLERSQASTSASSQQTNSTASNHSSDTEEYELAENHNTPPMIEINDTQDAQSDDDLIMIPQVIETIDLCTQALPTPTNFRHPVAPNEVIEIADSPLTQQAAGPSRAPGPVRNRRSRGSKSPYQKPQTTSTPKRLDLSDSLDDGKAVKLSCPICLDSVIGRDPVSTICGHIFCKTCLKESFKNVAKKCPLCKRTLKAANGWIDLYLGN